MHEAACYTRSFLKEVILRLDFGTVVEAFGHTLPPEIAAAALQRFKIAEPRAVQSGAEDSMQWVYHGLNLEKTLTITPAMLLITNKKYAGFKELNNDFAHLLTLIFEAQAGLNVVRSGLRYVNVIDVPEGSPLAWSEYINENMRGIMGMHKDAQPLSGNFHVVEFDYDGLLVKSQLGIANFDCHELNNGKQLVLDIGSYFNGALTKEGVTGFVNAAHEKIQALFEKSISEKTRALMMSKSN